MEEKDDLHLKCPEDAASISSNSVRWYYCLHFCFGDNLTSFSH